MSSNHAEQLRAAVRAGWKGEPMPPRPIDREEIARNRERAEIHRRLAVLYDYLAKQEEERDCSKAVD